MCQTAYLAIKTQQWTCFHSHWIPGTVNVTDKLSMATQSVMFYNVNVHTQTRGPDPDLVVRESFLVEVTCKLRPEG